MARKSKPVVFTDKENYLLEWVESQGIAFGTYVKLLIREKYLNNDKKISSDPIDIPKQAIESNGTLGNKAKRSYKSIIGE